jgi:hypothetical protein
MMKQKNTYASLTPRPVISLAWAMAVWPFSFVLSVM